MRGLNNCLKTKLNLLLTPTVTLRLILELKNDLLDFAYDESIE
jgi:hypothetical protein